MSKERNPSPHRTVLHVTTSSLFKPRGHVCPRTSSRASPPQCQAHLGSTTLTLPELPELEVDREWTARPWVLVVVEKCFRN